MRYIDLTDKTENQITVDREDGIYLGHPTTVLLDDGRTIYTVYPKGHGVGQLVMKRSDDAGLTWSERLPVPDSFSISLECPTIYKLTDRDGVERLFIFAGRYPFRSSVSTDNGKSWSEFSPIVDFGGYFMSTIVEIGKGEYLALFHDEGAFIHGGDTHRVEVYRAGDGADARTRQREKKLSDDGRTWIRTSAWNLDVSENPEREGDIWRKVYETSHGDTFADGHYELYQIRTTDGGLTWSEPERICATKEPTKLCEPCMIKSPDGKRIAVLLRENSRKKQSMFAVTDDNGQNWSDVKELNGVLTGDRHCAKYLRDGRLFVSFRDMNPDSPYYQNWVAWIGSFDDILHGRDGDCKLRLKKSCTLDCAYPGVEVLADGTVVAVTYGQWEENAKNYILCVRISGEEIKDY